MDDVLSKIIKCDCPGDDHTWCKLKYAEFPYADPDGTVNVTKWARYMWEEYGRASGNGNPLKSNK